VDFRQAAIFSAAATEPGSGASDRHRCLGPAPGSALRFDHSFPGVTLVTL